MRKLPLSWNVSDVEHDGHSGTKPHSRHSRNFAKPRWFSRSTALRPAASSSASARESARENMERDPPPNSRAMSTTCTAGSGRPLARSGSSTWCQRGSFAHACRASIEGVALPSTTAAPARRAIHTATSRA